MNSEQLRSILQERRREAHIALSDFEEARDAVLFELRAAEGNITASQARIEEIDFALEALDQAPAQPKPKRAYKRRTPSRASEVPSDSATPRAPQADVPGAGLSQAEPSMLDISQSDPLEIPANLRRVKVAS